MKLGDKVRVKSLDWYESNIEEEGHFYIAGLYFRKDMARFCGKYTTIVKITLNGVKLDIDNSRNYWNNQMLEEV